MPPRLRPLPISWPKLFGAGPGRLVFKENSILPYLALTGMALLFGMSFVATKFALRALPPFTLIFLRFSLAFLFLGVIYWRRKDARLLPRDRGHMFLASLIVPGGYFLCETYGLKLSSATTISLLTSTIPIFAALFALMLLKEKIGWWRWVAIFLSILGVALIISADGRGAMAAGNLVRAGNLLGLGAALCAGLYIGLGRDLMNRYSPLTITTFQAFAAMAIFLPLAGVEWLTYPRAGFQPLTLVALIYLALFCSVGAFFLWNYGISRLEASKGAVFTNLVPVFTVIGAGIFLGERILPEQAIGGILVIGGVTLAGATRAHRTGEGKPELNAV